jgi:hypothetical protein
VYKPFTQIHTPKTLQKHFTGVWPHTNVAEILCQCDKTQPHTSLKMQEAITKLRWTFLPQHHTAQILLPQISTSLEPWKTQSAGKVWEWWSYWRSGSECKILVQEGDRCSYFLLTQGCWSWQKLCQKMRSSYVTSTSKELYNKILAINHSVAEHFAQSS